MAAVAVALALKIELIKSLFSISYIEVKLGSINIDNMPISFRINEVDKAIWIHEHFSFPINDIGLIKLPKEVCITDDVKPIKLPILQESIEGKIMTVSGFGRDETGVRPSILQFLDEIGISRNECVGVYGEIVNSKKIVCTFGHPETKMGVCYGDGGAPLITKDNPPILVGIASFISSFGENYKNLEKNSFK